MTILSPDPEAIARYECASDWCRAGVPYMNAVAQEHMRLKDEQRAAFAAALGCAIPESGWRWSGPRRARESVANPYAEASAREPLWDHAEPLALRRGKGRTGAVGWMAEPYAATGGDYAGAAFEERMRALQGRLDVVEAGAWQVVSPEPWRRLSLHYPNWTAFMAVVPVLTHPAWSKINDHR